MKNLALFFSIIFLASGICFAQTSAFTYQGKLADSGSPANGQYDFVFKLFSLSAGGAQIGADAVHDDVQVTAGIFTVNLDFGSSPFTSDTARYLEIAVRAGAGAVTYTTLTPRQPITSSPYSVSTIRAASSAVADNALQLGGVAASQYVQTTDSRLTDDRNPLPNNPNYVQNRTTQQSLSNFNVSGNGTVGGTLTGNVVNATTQYNIGGNRLLSTNVNGNFFAGVGAGTANTTGFDNSFFGRNSGQSNTTGGANSFFGSISGQSNTTSFNNSFFGAVSGASNTTGEANSFFGSNSGAANTIGVLNSFFGVESGALNTEGSLNSFFGGRSGGSNTLGGFNSFFGDSAGFTNTTGSNNTMLGYAANVGSNNLSFATAVGAGSIVSASNTVVLGRNSDTVQIPGALSVTGGTTFGGTLGANIFNATTQYNVGGNRILSGSVGDNVFAGRTAGISNTSGILNSFFGNRSGEANLGGSSNSFFGERSGLLSQGINNSFFGAVAGQSNTTGGNNTIIGTLADVGAPNLSFATAIGAGAVVSSSNTVVLGRSTDTVQIPGPLDVTGRVRIGVVGSAFGESLAVGTVRLEQLGSAGSTSLCQNFFLFISSCSSSIRYKQNIDSFNQGLSLIKQLRPVSFNWRANNQADFGLVAEEVNQVEPLLTTTNDKGEIEGVKYDRIGVVLVNAVQEQQRQIEAQQEQLVEQNQLIKKQEERFRKQQAEMEALKILVCSQNPTAGTCRSKK